MAKTTASQITYYPPSLVIKSGFWYLATPYAKWASKDDAAAHAAAITGRLLAQDVKVFSPIAHSHMIHTYAPSLPNTHEFWLGFDKHFVDLAHGLLVAALPGWDQSVGVAQEIEWFKEAKKPRYLLDPMDLGCRKGVV